MPDHCIGKVCDEHLAINIFDKIKYMIFPSSVFLDCWFVFVFFLFLCEEPDSQHPCQEVGPDYLDPVTWHTATSQKDKQLSLAFVFVLQFLQQHLCLLLATLSNLLENANDVMASITCKLSVEVSICSSPFPGITEVKAWIPARRERNSKFPHIILLS